MSVRANIPATFVQLLRLKFAVVVACTSAKKTQINKIKLDLVTYAKKTNDACVV